MLLPLSVKLPLEATAVVMVGLLAVYLFERTPELRQAAREVAPRQEAAAPAKEMEKEQLADKAAPSPARPRPRPRPRSRRERRASGIAPMRPARRRSTRRSPASPPAASAPARAGRSAAAGPFAARRGPSVARGGRPPPELKSGAKTETAPSENVAGAARPEAESRQRILSPTASGDAARGAASSSRLAAKRALPPADVVARVAVQDRDAAERELAALVARLGGSVTQRRREDEATVVEAVIPQPRYAEFSDSVARIGTLAGRGPAPDLPAQVHVILRLQ